MKELRNSKRVYKQGEIVDIEFDAEMARHFYDATNTGQEGGSFTGAAVPEVPPGLSRLTSDGLATSAKEIQERGHRQGYRQGLKR